jgi:DinB family protein
MAESPWPRLGWSHVPNKTLTREQVLTLLAETPTRIAELTSSLSRDQLRTPPGPEEWSANDVLAHLRACADVWGDAMLTIIAGDQPMLRATNPLTWITKTNYPDLDFRRSFGAFARQRSELLPVLERLPREGWSRTITVTGAGSLLVRDVLFYGRWMAGHERTHVKQVARIVASV